MKSTKKTTNHHRTATAVLDPNELLDIREAAQQLKVSTQTVRQLTYDGGLRFTRIGAQLRFKRAWVEAFIERDAR